MNCILAVDQVLSIGLLCAGFDTGRQQRVERATNVGRFMSHFGSSPLVCAMIWEDLVTARDIWENQTHQQAASFENFLMAMYFLKVYPTEEKLAGIWKTWEKSARKWVWLFVLKIKALKEKKVSCICVPLGFSMHRCIHLFLTLCAQLLPDHMARGVVGLWGKLSIHSGRCSLFNELSHPSNLSQRPSVILPQVQPSRIWLWASNCDQLWCIGLDQRTICGIQTWYNNL